MEGLNRGFSPGRPNRPAVLLAGKKGRKSRFLAALGMTECGRRTTQKKEKQVPPPPFRSRGDAFPQRSREKGRGWDDNLQDERAEGGREARPYTAFVSARRCKR